jgi:ABC-type lipopolysaccharide export system ATPase subunit
MKTEDKFQKCIFLLPEPFILRFLTLIQKIRIILEQKKKKKRRKERKRKAN